MTELSDLTGEMAGVARRATYVAVGLGVLGFQRAMVERRRLEAVLAGDPSFEVLRTAVSARVGQADDLVESATRLVESAIEPLEDQLPAAARVVTGRAVDRSRQVRAQLRQLVAGDD